MVYIGVDLHRKKSQVAAIDQDGKLALNRKVRTGPAELQQLFDELRPQPIEVAFEATFGWGWFADLLAELGIPAHMAHPLATKAISSARVKNDAVDAKTLAHLLRTNLLPEGWIAPPDVRESRRLVRMRAALVRVRAKLKAQIHALLGEHGIQPDVVDLFSNRGRELLGQFELPAISQSRLQACLRLIDEVSLEIVIAEREIQQKIKDDKRLERLLPIPGIGPIIAATILSEIGDVTRFASADKLCAWAGLTPSEHSSADHLRRGHISKQGSRWLRWAWSRLLSTLFATSNSDSSSSGSRAGAGPRSPASLWRDGCSRSSTTRFAARLAVGAIRSLRIQRSRRARWLSWPLTETAGNLIEPSGPNHTMDIRSE